MNQDVGQFQITMDDALSPEVLTSVNNLLEYLRNVSLRQTLPNFVELLQVAAITVVLHHVDV